MSQKRSLEDAHSMATNRTFCLSIKKLNITNYNKNSLEENDSLINKETAGFEPSNRLVNEIDKQMYKELIQKLANDALENKFENKKFKVENRIIEKEPTFNFYDSVTDFGYENPSKIQFKCILCYVTLNVCLDSASFYINAHLKRHIDDQQIKIWFENYCKSIENIPNIPIEEQQNCDLVEQRNENQIKEAEQRNDLENTIKEEQQDVTITMDQGEQIGDELLCLIKCEYCKQIYDDPIILPCNETICSKHLLEDSFVCQNCNKIHSKQRNVYPTDKKTLKLIEVNKKYVNIDQINFGFNHQNAKVLLEELETLIGKINPTEYLDKVFNEMKTKINSTKEQYFNLIETNYNKIMNQVINFEQECRDQVANTTSVFNKTIQQTTNDLNKWKEMLNIPDFSKDSQWKKLSLNAEIEIEKLKILIKQCEDDLLLNKEFDFVPKSILNDNNFGDLKNQKKEIIEEKLSHGSLKFTIDNFNQFKETREVLTSQESIIIHDIPWKVSVKMREKKDSNIVLGFFLRPLIKNEELILNHLKISAKFKIIQHNDSKTFLKKKLKDIFNGNCSFGFGFSNFILLDDILDESNGIYNQQKDQITLEAYFKIK